MTSLSDTLTVGLVLVLLFGSIALYLYTRVQQAEQKISLLESILLDLKMSAEIKSYSELPAINQSSVNHSSVSQLSGSDYTLYEEEDNTEDNKEDVETSTGDTITVEQAVVEKNLQEILDMSLSNAKLKLLNKSIYTKLDNVTPRTTPYVNNGVVNNSYGGKIATKNTKIGIVKESS